MQNLPDVTEVEANAQGQWRLPGEASWHHITEDPATFKPDLAAGRVKQESQVAAGTTVLDVLH